jgi:hypothetical protein
VRFEAEHRFHGSPQAVAAILIDPMFYVSLELPDVSRPVVLEPQGEHEQSSRSIRLRYEFTGQLDPLGRRLLGDHLLSWTQLLELGADGRCGTLEFAAEAAPRLLHGSASFTLEEVASSRSETLRRLSGELVVAMPGVGRIAERRIVPGLLRRMDTEAEALNDRLLA